MAHSKHIKWIESSILPKMTIINWLLYNQECVDRRCIHRILRKHQPIRAYDLQFKLCMISHNINNLWLVKLSIYICNSTTMMILHKRFNCALSEIIFGVRTTNKCNQSVHVMHFCARILNCSDCNLF